MICINRHPIGLILALLTASYGMSPAIAQQSGWLDAAGVGVEDLDVVGHAGLEHLHEPPVQL